MCVFLDSETGMDNAPMVQPTIIETIDSMVSGEVPKMDDISILESSVVHLENPEIDGSKLQ